MLSTAFAPATGSGSYVAKSGDTMTGTLILPVNGLVAGTNQLVLTGGNTGLGTASPSNKLSVAGSADFSTSIFSPLYQPLPGGGASLAIRANDNGFGAGGGVNISGGVSNSTGQGGSISLTGGLSNSSSAGAGGVTLTGGVANSFGFGGPVNITGGTGNSTSGGGVTIFGGQANALGSAGTVFISGGFGNGTTAGNLVLAGGTFTGIGSNGVVSFQTGGAERARIDPSGNVGVGIMTPGQKLSVAGMIESTTGGFKFPDGTVQSSAGGGTSTNISAGTGIVLTPNPIVGVGTVSVDPAAVPFLGTANNFTAANSFSGSNSSAIVTVTQNGAGAATPSLTPPSPSAVLGQASATTNSVFGVLGTAVSPNGIGVIGVNLATINASNSGSGVFGATFVPSGSGVEGHAFSTSGGATGVFGRADGPTGIGGQFIGATALMTQGPSIFNGDVSVNGTLTASTKNFRVDDPLDPKHKYLVHASIESSEVLNLYSGNVVLDAAGKASVPLPNWMQAENKDFRYQLTCVGGFAPVYIAQKMAHNRFGIAGGKPGMEISWQITGVRNDAYAQAHPMRVEQPK